MPLSTDFLPHRCHSPLTFMEGRSGCHCEIWRGSCRLRTRSWLKQRTSYLPSRRHLLTCDFQVRQKRRRSSRKRTGIQRTWTYKRSSRQMACASTAASKTILLRPVKHQRRKRSRRPTNSKINNLLAMHFQVTSPSNNSDWWLDTSATYHVCTNKDLFSTYVVAKKNGLIVDHSTVVVLGAEIVVLTFTSRKTLTLKSVKHIPSIFKNLVSKSLLCDARMRIHFQTGRLYCLTRCTLAMLITLMACAR